MQYVINFKSYLLKNRLNIVTGMLAIVLFSSAYTIYAFARDPLPTKLKIYVNEAGLVLTTTQEGYVPKVLPVANIFIGTPGCYIRCHSTNPDKSIFKISPNIHVIGLIRIEGQYEGSNCRPRDYEKAEIKDEVIFRELCSKAYQCIGNSCWAGPDTGGLFGLK